MIYQYILNDGQGFEIVRHIPVVKLSIPRNTDVLRGEDAATNRNDHAPRNIASFNNLTLAIFKTVSPSPKRALEHFQDDKNRAISML